MYFPTETSWEYSGKTHDYFNGTTSIAPVVEENELKLHIYGDVLEVQGTESGISIYAISRIVLTHLSLASRNLFAKYS